MQKEITELKRALLVIKPYDVISLANALRVGVAFNYLSFIYLTKYTRQIQIMHKNRYKVENY